MKVKGLNDAKYTAVVVLITTILLIGFIILPLTLSLNYINAYSVIAGAFAWIFATTVLGFMFVPKVINKLSIYNILKVIYVSTFPKFCICVYALNKSYIVYSSKDKISQRECITATTTSVHDVSVYTELDHDYI